MSSNANPNELEADNRFRDGLAKDIDDKNTQFKRTKRRWNWVYYGSLFGSIIASALSALILKWKIRAGTELLPWQENTAAVLATAAAISTTILAAGGFERRWLAARTARAALKQLKLDLLNPNKSAETVSDQLKDIIWRYEEDVTGGGQT